MNSFAFLHGSRSVVIFKIILIAVAILLITEVVALLWLKWSVGHYKTYWLQRAKESGQITYVALGDSAAQGIGATSPSRGYVGLLAKRLESQTGKTVRVINLSKTGAKMGDYLGDQVPQLAVIKPDIVTIEIGANDIVNFNDRVFRSQFQMVLASLPDGSYVANMPLFNSRPKLTNDAKKASAIIAEEIKAYPKLHYVDLQKQTSQHQSIFGFAPDLFHPNNLSYKNWADAFWLQITAKH